MTTMINQQQLQARAAGSSSGGAARAFAAAAPRPARHAPAALTCRASLLQPQQQQQLCGHRRSASFATFAAAAASASSTRQHRQRGQKGRAARLVVRAGWGDPVEFAKARVVSNAKVAEGPLHKVVVDVGAALAAGYTTGGQFIQVKVAEDAKPGFFAIASPPDPNNQGLLELLIKANGAAAEAVAALGAGSEALVSPVMGKGFDVSKIPAATTPLVLLFATGSGISPIRALLESGALDATESVRLYYGTRDASHTAYLDSLDAWRKRGVDVVQVYSNNDAARYVQEAFKADPKLPADASGVGVVLCGHKGMVEAVKEVAAAAGVPADKVLLNF